MATEKTEEPKATKAVKNPSGASKEQLEKGEKIGQARGPDVDKTFHVYEFEDS